MDISLNIILDRLSHFRLDNHISSMPDRKICRAELPGNSLDDFSENFIYVSRLSQILPIDPERRKNAVFICLRDRISDTAETEEALQGIVVVNENISYESLFSCIQEIFYQIGSWYQKAMEAIIQNRSLQDIIDLSEGVLCNYIQITDSSFKLLGYTKGIECDDEITVQARKYGFHPESTIKIFNKYHRIQLWERSTDILVNQDRIFSNYDLVSKIFRFSNTYFAHAVMVCNNTPLSKGTVELFELFMEIISVFIEKDWESTNECHHIYDTFLTDLYEGNLPRKDIIEERARHVGIPVTGNFFLTITSADESGKHTNSAIAKEFSHVRPDDKIVILNGRLSILSILNSKNLPENFERLYGDLEQIMEKFDLRCGISEVFKDLIQAPSALLQAQQALSCSGRTPGVKLLPFLKGATNGLQRRAVSFEDSYHYILLGNSPANRETWKGSVYYKALKLLDDYDQQHNMNNLHLLYVYLVCESRAAEAGNLLHMSRNNVVYRIDRIAQMIDMDLKKPSIRIKLLITYILLQLYGFE